MSAFGTKPPVDPIWRHKPSTPSARLTILADRARQALARDMTLQELAVAISATESEAKDAAQAIGAACFLAEPGLAVAVAFNTGASVAGGERQPAGR